MPAMISWPNRPRKPIGRRIPIASLAHPLSEVTGAGELKGVWDALMPVMSVRERLGLARPTCRHFD